MNRTVRTGPSGFASVFAVVLIALVGIAFSAMAAVMRVEMRQAIAERADVQIRQLLVAAEQVARDLAAGEKSQDVDVPLPAALQENVGGLTLKRDDKGDTFEVTIRARYMGFSRTEVVAFTRNDMQLRSSRATLGPLVRAN